MQKGNIREKTEKEGAEKMQMRHRKDADEAQKGNIREKTEK